MKFTPKQYAQALHEAIHETNPKDHDKILNNFVKVLQETGNISKFEEIEQEYKKIELSEKGIKQAAVTVAREISIDTEIVEKLNKSLNTNLEITKKIDGNKIGGIVLRMDDTVMDASIKTQLQKLNSSLKS